MPAFLILEPRCVFLHIPKTGGTSIRRGYFENNVEGPHQGYVPDEWSDLFKFGFVRHPLDRLISAWKMFTEGMDNTVKEWSAERKDISLVDFLAIASDESIPFDGARDTVEKKIRVHTLPMTHPFYCLDQADFIGRFERLNEDFAIALSHVGVNAAKLPHWNISKRKPDFSKYFKDANVMDAAVELYRNDFREFDYTLP